MAIEVDVHDSTGAAAAADALERDLADLLEKIARRYPAVAEFLRELRAIDHGVYRAVAVTPTPSLDDPLRRLSDAANYSRLWLASAAVLAVAGGERGRRAAWAGVASLGATSLLVNLGVKPLGRARPDRFGHQVPVARHTRMPLSASFPSGHAASGFAFASAVGTELPLLTLPLSLAALAVAYSRIHTGVHYPTDAIAGGVIGSAIGEAVAGLLHRRRFHRG